MKIWLVTIGAIAAMAMVSYAREIAAIDMGGDDVTVTMTAGNPGDGHVLYYAWDASGTDHGETLGDWPNVVRLGRVPDDATSFSFALPAAALPTGSSYSCRAFLATSDRNYDSLVEYVASTGTQYVNTQIIGKPGTKAELDFVLTELPVNGGLLAARKANSGDDRFYLAYYYQGFRFAYGKLNASASPTLAISANTRYLATTTIENGSQSVTLSDGATQQSVLATESGTWTTGSNALDLFNMNANGGHGNASKARLYSCKIWQKEGGSEEYALARDYKPCLRNGTPGLYDAKNNTFSASATSTALVASSTTNYLYCVEDGEVPFAASPAFVPSHASLTFTGGDATDSTDWFAPANWDGNAIPSLGDSVDIPSGKTVVLSGTTPFLSSASVSGTLVFTNWTTRLSADAVTIPSGGIVTCAGPFTDAQMSNRVWIACENLTVASGGKIDVNEKGYGSLSFGTQTYGPGAGSRSGGGGAHGGYGGYGNTGSGATYGNHEEPVTPGSTGRFVSGQSGMAIASGGGAVRIDATGTVTLNGTVSANGKSGNWGYGGGSGGSILVFADKIVADGGSVTTKGGNGAGDAVALPGGGGRIALRYNTESQSVSDLARLTVSAGPGQKFTGSTARDWNFGSASFNADIGTVYFTDSKPLKFLGTSLTGQIYLGSGASYSCDSIAMTSGWVRFAQEGFVLDVAGNVALSGKNTRLEMGGGEFLGIARSFPRLVSGSVPWTLSIDGDLTLSGCAWLSGFAASTNGTANTVGGSIEVAGDLSVSGVDGSSKSTVCLACCPTNGAAVVVTANNINIGEGTLVTAEMRGFALDHGTSSGKAWYSGSGTTANANQQVGAGHGGFGNGGTELHGATYDSPVRPLMPGSGGVYADNASDMPVDAASGGGVVHLKAANAMTVAGTINASAKASMTAAASACRFAAASGGSILLECKTFNFPATGVISANGGSIKDTDTTFVNGGAGGGGRIAVWTGRPYVEGDTKAGAISATDAKPAEYLGSFSVDGGYYTDSSGKYRKYSEEGGWQTTIEKSEATVRGGDGTIRFVTVAGGCGTIIFVR